MRWGGQMSWILGLIALLAGASLFYSPWRIYRYRMTVEVSTPDGPRTGFAVREIRWKGQPALTPEAHALDVRQRGQAVMVDLPSGRTLFALLNRNPHETILSGFYAIAGRKGAMGALLSEADSTRSVYEMPSPQVLRSSYLPYPALVTFEDPADPMTVEPVEPADLAAVFGPGYSLERITVQITDEPVTMTIRKRLPWLGFHPEPRLDPDNRWSINSTFAHSLWHGDFHQGTI